jgi:hypothetical protein
MPDYHLYTGNSAMDLQSEMHGNFDTGFFVSGFRSRITGMLDSSVAGDYLTLTSHIGREYFKKLSNMGLYVKPFTGYNGGITDDFDAGFRPKTVTGLYDTATDIY